MKHERTNAVGRQAETIQKQREENAALKAEVERLRDGWADAALLANALEEARVQRALTRDFEADLAEAVGLLRGSSVRYGNGPAVDKEIRAFLAKHPATEEK